MDSPLNRAHQWGRKADTLSAAGKYDEAIACHNRAAENLLETLQSPVLYDNPSLMSCLRQQHEHHLRQVKILQSKQLRKANLEACRGRPVTMRSKAVQTGANARSGIRHDNVLINTQNIEESIKEADTMLRFLKLRKEDPEVELPWQRAPAEMGGDPAETGSDVDVVAVKKPKGDKVIIEELRCLTGELQEHIKQLVQESECLKAENQKLSTKLNHQQQQQGGGEEEPVQDLMPLPSHLTLSTSFPLPPLEMPVLQQPPKLSSDSEDDLSDRL